MKRALVLLALALCLACTACGTLVPDVTGMTLDDATDQIEAAGFSVGDVTYDADSAAPQGTVVAQLPSAEDRAEDGSAIAVTLAGPPPVPAPDVVGLTAEEAEEALAELGLIVGDSTEEYDETIPVGEIMSQDPAADEMTPVGAAVNLVLSKGPEPVPMPDVVGMSQDEAEEELTALGFVVATGTVDDKAAQGTVMLQEPSAGEPVVPSSTVTITVSTGIEMVIVPNVYGMGKDAAAAKIRAAGLVCSSRAYFDDGYGVGVNCVCKQSPGGGASVAKGSTVTIWYLYDVPAPPRPPAPEFSLPPDFGNY